METILLGRFTLSFEPCGKLAQLSADGIPLLLEMAPYPLNLGEGRIFEPRGWDECFPTIEPFGASPLMGDLISKNPVHTQQSDSFSQEWTSLHHRVSRTFSAPSPDLLLLQFSVRNEDHTHLNFLWASHAVFTLTNLLRVEFNKDTLLEDFSLNGTFSKNFLPNTGSVRLQRQEGTFLLETDQPWWGIWLNRGGWPERQPAGFGCLAIEASNTNSDLPREAFLHPGETFRASVSLQIASIRAAPDD